MTDYSQLSDFEINKRVAISRGLIVQEIDDSKSTGMTSRYHELRPNTVWASNENEPWNQYAPCNSWDDAGPIIAESGISLVSIEAGLWCADYNACWIDGLEWQIDGIIHQNPLRAAMMAFLMKKESESS